jgi:hypothetical protein
MMGTSRVLAFCLIRVAEQRLQRLLAGPGRHQDLVQRGQDGIQRDQVLGPVVDQKDSGPP